MQKIEIVEAGNPAEGTFPKMKLSLEQDGEVKQLELDLILFATGRKPNVEGMGLQEAHVDYDQEDGIYSNNQM